jgi:hypothetical protein
MTTAGHLLIFGFTVRNQPSRLYLVIQIPNKYITFVGFDHEQSLLMFGDTFYSQILSDDDRRLFSNGDGCIICVGPYVFREDADIYPSQTIIILWLGEKKYSIPATLRFLTPYTLSRSSTTPPWSRSFMAQVPHCKQILSKY